MTEPSKPPPGEQPDPAEEAVAAATAEFLDMRAEDRWVDPEAFCRRYPHIEAELRASLETISMLDACLDGEPAAPIDDAAPLPERLSGHRIVGVIGSGGMGRVLLAVDEDLGRQVAVKTLHPALAADPRLRDRFMREARALALLTHPNIVRIYNLGRQDEAPHFVMEYVPGAPLLDAARPLTLEQRITLFRKVVLAVAYLHENGVVHRDLKPANIRVGPDLEPRLLDFGLARRWQDPAKVTRAGEVLGTPDYLSPEQARGEDSLDGRSDVFSLGTILYELLTGTAPFRGESLPVQIRRICETDPALPRRLNSSIPGPLQNICLQCLEKKREDRYQTAEELGDDLARFLAGEPVLALPSAYSRLTAGKIDQHLRELRSWEQDRLLNEQEFDAFRRLYGRLAEREDAWILEARQLSLSQVSLYLGAWVLVVGAALVFLFRYAALSGTPAVAVVAAAAIPTVWIGIRCWKRHQKRIGVAFLLASCLLLPATLLVAMKEWGILTGFTHGKESLELFAFLGLSEADAGPFRGTTNAQLFWALALSMPAYAWLRRFTKSSVFSLVLAVMGAVLCTVILLRMGMLEWFESDPGRAFFRLIPFAVLFFLAAAIIERSNHPGDSRYFYPVAILFTFLSLSGLALLHEPWARWLERTIPKTRGQLEYLFIINAAVYLSIQSLTERFGSPQMRSVAKVFRFVIPGHVLTSLLLLGLAAGSRWQAAPQRGDLRVEARLFEFALPAVACLFVLGSVPKQMKNFFVTGMVFLAIGIVRLQQDFFRDRATWPVVLLVTGLSLMLFAANYTPIRLRFGGFFRGKRRTPGPAHPGARKSVETHRDTGL